MWPYNNFYGFGGGGVQYPPTWQSGGGQTTGGNTPWWVGVGVGLGERLGVWDWAADWLGTGGSGGQGQNGGGNPFAFGNPADTASNIVQLVSNEVQEAYKEGSPQRNVILNYYQQLQGGKENFINWLKTIGLSASIAGRLLSGDILQWPGIFKDLIILYYHVRDTAESFGPQIVTEANKSGDAVPALPGGPGAYLGTIAALRPPTLPLVPREAYHVPKGYVLVRDPQTKQPAVVLKELARAAGLYRPRAKAPIKASEWRAAKKAKRIEAKLSKMLGDSCNYKVTKKR